MDSFPRAVTGGKGFPSVFAEAAEDGMVGFSTVWLFGWPSLLRA